MTRLPAGAPILSAEAMRAAEQACFDAGTSQAELMERAGRAVAREAARFALGRPILVLAGPGNNGGDAYAAARHLHERGYDVSVAALGGAEQGAAAEMRAHWQGETVPLGDAPARPMLVDGLFGTGMSRPLEGEVKARLHALSSAAEFVLAIDLPSGLATDSAADLGAARATATLALGALKPAHVLAAECDRCGHVRLADIGIACPRDTTTIARPILSSPPAASHKYSRGMVVVVEGEMPGASRLAARAALNGGAGYVVLAGQGAGGPDALVHRMVRDADDLRDMLGDSRIASVVIGPGLGRDDHARALLEVVIDSDRSLVLDGDALTLLGTGAADRIAARGAPSLLTPHEGEFARMFPDGEGSKLDRTRDAARRCAATLVHKGPDTVIARADGSLTVASAGTSWLSTAGTGDVLAGLCAARQAVSGAAGADAAVWLHGRAARLAGPAFVADDLIGHIAPALEECL